MKTTSGEATTRSRRPAGLYSRGVRGTGHRYCIRYRGKASRYWDALNELNSNAHNALVLLVATAELYHHEFLYTRV